MILIIINLTIFNKPITIINLRTNNNLINNKIIIKIKLIILSQMNFKASKILISIQNNQMN
jgi:hypothetical protein